MLPPNWNAVADFIGQFRYKKLILSRSQRSLACTVGSDDSLAKRKIEKLSVVAAINARRQETEKVLAEPTSYNIGQNLKLSGNLVTTHKVKAWFGAGLRKG